MEVPKLIHAKKSNSRFSQAFRALAFACLVTTLVASAGCGGGGGGGGGSAPAPAPVARVTATFPLATPLQVGKTVQMQAQIVDASGILLGNRPLAWASDAPQFASVDKDTGVVSGVSPGTAHITASSEGVVSDPVTVVVSDGSNPPPAVTSFTVTPSSPVGNLLVGGTLQLQARDQNGNLLVATFSVNQNGPFISLSSSGLITGMSPGTAFLTVSYGSLAPQQISVIVNANPTPTTTITVTPQTFSNLVVGQTLTLDVRQNGILVNAMFSAASPSGIISQNGNVVTGVAPGTTSIIVSYANATPVTVTITVVPAAVIPTITVQPTSIVNLAVSSTQQLTVRDQNNNLVNATFSVTQSGTFVSINATGLVQGLAAGSGTITVSYDGATPVTVNFTVATNPLANQNPVFAPGSRVSALIDIEVTSGVRNVNLTGQPAPGAQTYQFFTGTSATGPWTPASTNPGSLPNATVAMPVYTATFVLVRQFGAGGANLNVDSVTVVVPSNSSTTYTEYVQWTMAANDVPAFGRVAPKFVGEKPGKAGTGIHTWNFDGYDMAATGDGRTFAITYSLTPDSTRPYFSNWHWSNTTWGDRKVQSGEMVNKVNNVTTVRVDNQIGGGNLAANHLVAGAVNTTGITPAP